MARPVLLLLLAMLAPSVLADEFKPAFLQLTETAPGRYDVLWKVPALDADSILNLNLVFPKGSHELKRGPQRYIAGAAVTRWKVEVPGGLYGKTIHFDGKGTKRTDILVLLARADGSEQLERVNPHSLAFTARASPGPWEVIGSYTRLGIEHILFGVDHLLFVAALVVLVRGPKQLIFTITSFTLAHSITLALATLGLLNVAGPPVEASISLSIVFVAMEILHREQGHPSLASTRPWLVSFSFGLLHGLGFASALAEVGLPKNSIPLALLFFNVGVEIGQLMFVALLLVGVAAVRRIARSPKSRRLAMYGTGYAIGGTASFWLIERLSNFFTRWAWPPSAFGGAGEKVIGSETGVIRYPPLYWSSPDKP